MKNAFKKMFVVLFVIGTFLFSINVKLTGATEVYPFNGIINADSLVVHSDSVATSNVTELVYGSRVTVLEMNEKGNRYKIKYDGGKIGYVSSNYVINVDTNTLTTDYNGAETYRTYCDLMIGKGFVESYCPYLYYLHVKHPTWIFEPNLIESTLENASERELEKVSLQTKNSNYWYYKDGIPLVNEYSSSGNYYFVNADVISSFMDPRNSMFEKTIFQFLNLEKNTDAINENALSKIPGSGNYGNLKLYYNEFMTAANTVGINALHLMARSKQEGADKIGYSATTGTFSTDKGLLNPDGRTLDGFYNFYNIGSYVQASSGYTSSIQRGLAYAAGYIDDSTTYGRPWDTPEKAVVGGGEWIGNLYVKNGQNTNYFQKFNIANYSGNPIFTHQYMTNAYAPTAESFTMNSAYNAGSLLETNFEFVIPVFQNMRDDAYQAVDKSNDSKLSSISVNGEVIPEFDKDVVEYTVNVLTAESFVEVAATLNNGGATITTGMGRADFVDGNAVVKINVLAEDGVTNTEYVINIKQVLPEVNITVNDIVNGMGVKINNDYMYGISPGTIVSTLINNVINNKGNATITDKDGNVKSGGSLVTGDKIVINGTTESKTYIIAVRGDSTGDGVVKINDLILIQSHILGTRYLEGDKFLAADVNYDGVIKINDLILVQSHILEKGSL